MKGSRHNSWNIIIVNWLQCLKLHKLHHYFFNFSSFNCILNFMIRNVHYVYLGSGFHLPCYSGTSSWFHDFWLSRFQCNCNFRFINLYFIFRLISLGISWESSFEVSTGESWILDWLGVGVSRWCITVISSSLLGKLVS